MSDPVDHPKNESSPECDRMDISEASEMSSPGDSQLLDNQTENNKVMSCRTHQLNTFQCGDHVSCINSILKYCIGRVNV